MTTVQTRESSKPRKRPATSAQSLIANFKAAEHALTLGGKTVAERVRNFGSRQEISRAMAILERVRAEMASLLVASERPVSPTFEAVAPQDTTRETFEALLAKGLLLDSAAFQERTGISRQAMSKAVTARRLFYVDLGARRGYPAFYADASLQRRQVEAVSKLLGDLPGGSKFLFFTTPKGSTAKPESGQARTPLQALRDGDFERVKRAAVGYAQR